MSETIYCPSGLVGRIRGMKVREERILADRKLAKSGAQLDEILAACWEETLEPDPYDFTGRAIDWGKVLQGDRFFALLQIRVLSYGPEYAFSIPCEQRACRARIDWELDLRQLPVRTLSESSRQTFAVNNRFEAFLPDAQRQVSFRLLTGADERRMSALRRAAAERPITTLLSVRLEHIDGIETAGKQRFIEELSMADVSFLLAAVDSIECGVETEIEVECPECLTSMRVELPFDKGFFLPDKRRTTTASGPASCLPM